MNGKKTNKGSRAGGSAKSTGPMDMGLLQQLVGLMAAHDLNTVDVRDGDKRIILKRGAPAPMMMQMASAPVAPVAAPAPARPGAPAGDAPDADLVAIKSPMVGTFYAAPGPDSKPFVAVGSRVTDDSDVCIIEAMKVFNNIKAECKGTVAKVLVQNGEAVEFGQTLFLVKPN